jgi:phage baseplate assembly protein W
MSTTGQPSFGNVELWLPANGDFSLNPNGDLKLAVDTANTSDATSQRLVRLMLTSPRQAPNINADDPFNPDYGAGLPSAVGSVDPNIASDITARISQALLNDPSVSTIQSITVSPNSNGLVSVQVVVVATNGQIVVLPSQLLPTT